MTVASEIPSATDESISFELTSEQKAIREAAREFALKEIDPVSYTHLTLPTRRKV